jgi:superfamily I DNA/RNA helicase
MARNVGEGHRLVFGVAGSGKTVVLIARAKLLAETNSRGQVLVLCFNLALRLYLSHVLAGLTNVRVLHFHSWAKSNIKNADWTGKEDNPSLGRSLLEALKNGSRDAGSFDAVLIDEAQDFCAEWFQCALLALKDAANSDLFIVGDASQGVYGKRKVSWKQLGIQAQGRTSYLEENYRNTRPILEVASLFSSTESDDGEDGISAPVVDPSRARRVAGPLPVMVQAANLDEECSRAAEIATQLISGHWFGEKISPLRPEEIGILYRSGKGPKWEVLARLRERLNAANIPTVWLTENLDSRHRMAEKVLKITTIHGCKGLQFRAVLLIFAGECPDLTSGGTEDEERRLFYVALTRAEDYLAITWSRDASFIADIKASGKARSV